MSFKTQRKGKGNDVCAICHTPTNSGKKWCSLHHPKKGTRPHVDKYSRGPGTAPDPRSTRLRPPDVPESRQGSFQAGSASAVDP